MSYLNAIAGFVEQRVAAYGTQVIMGVIDASPIGAAFAAATNISDIGQFRMTGVDLLKKLQVSVANPRRFAPAAWRRSEWAHSHDQWKRDAWKHDWRSQPRDRLGKWVPGRLSYPAISARQVGKGKQRTSRERRRINRYRRYGRVAARSIKLGG